MDATLYLMVQTPALEELLSTTDKDEVSKHTGIILAVFLVGAALGGIIAGILSDEFGRAYVMLATVLLYSVGTCLCALSQTWWQLMLLRFVTGLGTGGEWACGASLVAEVWPDRYRTIVGPILQAGGGTGFLVAGLVYYIFSPYGWRAVFLVGLFPAFLSILIRFFVDESKMWKEARDAKPVTFLQALTVVSNPPHAATTLSMIFVVGMHNLVYWSTSAWVPSIVRDTLKVHPQPSWSDDEATSVATIVLNIGAVLGALSWIWSADALGRKSTLALMTAGQMVILPAVFVFATDLNVMIPLLPLVGFFSGGVFGGMPVYLPELFPTYVRGTGTSLVYNAGRVLAALGPVLMAVFVAVTGNYHSSAAIMPLLHLITLFCLLFPRETRGKGLPRDDKDCQ
eukprot:c17628_g1_i1.p1 GENE.c17628_g1_i1~~c17628_g1_i1.p1  ORF type:complete len:456 (+),score=89.70 c17628_g1_i1:176-1369(+)